MPTEALLSVLSNPGTLTFDSITLQTKTVTIKQGVNYRITASFASAGSFSDAFFTSTMQCTTSSVTITEEIGYKTSSRASWLFYYSGLYGSSNVTFDVTASIYGNKWSDPENKTNVPAVWGVDELT